MQDLFRQFWWLIFPMFGMLMAILGAFQTENRARTALDLLKHYADQGKEPPPELIQLAMREPEQSQGGKNSEAWSFVVFAALASGFGVGYWMVRAEHYAFAFLTVTVVMGVLAVGALFIMLFGRK